MNAVPYLTIKSDHLTFEFTEEQFKLLMQENGIKCENCGEAYRVRDRNEPRVFKRVCLETQTRVADNHFCAYFTPKING